jgi:hypothetical protein
MRVALAPLGDRVDLGKSFLVAVEHVADRRLPELTSERDVLCVIDMLIAEEDHFPPDQSGADFLHGLRSQRPLEIDTGELGASEHGHWPNREHWPFVDRCC